MTTGCLVGLIWCLPPSGRLCLSTDASGTHTEVAAISRFPKPIGTSGCTSSLEIGGGIEEIISAFAQWAGV